MRHRASPESLRESDGKPGTNGEYGKRHLDTLSESATERGLSLLAGEVLCRCFGRIIDRCTFRNPSHEPLDLIQEADELKFECSGVALDALEAVAKLYNRLRTAK